MPKPVRLRRLAADDVEAAVDRHLREGGPDVAGRLIDAVEQAMTQVGRHPRNGSLRFSYDVGIPGLRVWPTRRFPYLIVYVETDSGIDVWRMLHTRRDAPTAFAEK